MRFNLSGEWKIKLNNGVEKMGFLPGSLDENGLGEPDKVAKAWHPDVEDREKAAGKMADKDPRIATRLTRNYTYEGPAVYSRTFDGEVSPDKRYFFIAERTRAAALIIDGQNVPLRSFSLSAPVRFEVTDYLKKGSLIEIVVDNTYPGMPYRDITFSSAATDETQTNWNGVLGNIFIDEKEPVFISSAYVYPFVDGADSVSLMIEIDAGCVKNADANCDSNAGNDKFSKSDECNYQIIISGDCLEEEKAIPVTLHGDGPTSVQLRNVRLNDNALNNRWDEGEGNLASIKIALLSEGKELHKKNVTFGIREFAYDEEGRLTINGRRIFLRSEANCGLFPETGYGPMDLDFWKEAMKTYASYGVNCVRFHSWCPPEAAFAAADEMGMMIQPELPNWNPRDAFSSEESRDFYENELIQILKTYANHPSFVMLTLGNELHGDEASVETMHHLMEVARSIDKTRLYAWGSNNFYGEKGTDPESDFYTSMAFHDKKLRLSGNDGYINTCMPDTTKNFDKELAEIRKEFKKPVFTFEVGQYEVLPDMKELELFKGVTRPDNLVIVDNRRKALGISDSEWERRVSATGEIALLAYREEVEAVLRTTGLSGISLLGLQDFTGQGTALVGMLNSHLKRKPYPFSEPERFKQFFNSQVVLGVMDRYTYEEGDVLRAEVKVANYGKTELPGGFEYQLISAENSSQGVGGAAYTTCPVGTVTSLGFIEISFNKIGEPVRYDLKIRVGDIETSYPVWVYPKVEPVCPEGVHETRVLDDKARDVLQNGGIVYYSPDSTKEAIPDSIKAQFTTDFWSVGTFPSQEGAMGLLIDTEHPIFRNFPTREFGEWQWFYMASQRAFVLPEYVKAIVTEMDCYVSLRPMAMLYEAKVLNGKILCSSMGLQNLMEHPEARALLKSIYEYLDSDEFVPKHETMFHF
ncbi:glycoside hydrolase family 2 TIM barrel-domain containing protein [Butyrivibrio proteoclasticus]|uniref:glycoside hydrolase family 2 TIM barrel-domain containing protein n=1 Tax=Butyrivibrio proteoclasticus TaxID=43305 RepID=UPI00047C3CB1|nr:glycoside hydrolase family 2 TIM barrel-domain containing protein [Butyrivibrio proteoclasticus]